MDGAHQPHRAPGSNPAARAALHFSAVARHDSASSRHFGSYSLRVRFARRGVRPLAHSLPRALRPCRRAGPRAPSARPRRRARVPSGAKRPRGPGRVRARADAAAAADRVAGDDDADADAARSSPPSPFLLGPHLPAPAFDLEAVLASGGTRIPPPARATDASTTSRARASRPPPTLCRARTIPRIPPRRTRSSSTRSSASPWR